MAGPVWLWWSSGKDCAWALHELRCQRVDVSALVTTFRAADDHVPMHEVTMHRVRAQAARTGLRLIEVPLPSPCPNEAYQAAVQHLIGQAAREGIRGMAFGDLFLADIRAYREALFVGSGISPLFPLWGRPTDRLAREMIKGGLEAEIVAVDPRRLTADHVGRPFDEAFLQLLPEGIDPCGENGEFHTFAQQGPMFIRP